MQGLNLTYKTLGESRNEAAIDVLVVALSSGNATTRHNAVSALMQRTEKRCPELVLAHWDRLDEQDIALLRERPRFMERAVRKTIKNRGPRQRLAIAAAKALGLTTAIDELVLLAESSSCRTTRQAAVDAIFEIVIPLGRLARADRDRSTIRRPVLARLADSLNRYTMHRNPQLVDAFLLAIAWGDADFRLAIGEASPQRDVIRERLAEGTGPDLHELAAGFIRRRNIPDFITALIQSRQGEEFRRALLLAVSSDPSSTTLRNLADVGVPKCCSGGETLMHEVEAHQRAALAYVYAAADSDDLRKLLVITTAIECGADTNATACCLARCPVPDAEVWMRAAIPVADQDQSGIEIDDTAKLLDRLIRLLDHPDAAVSKAVRRLLAPLHADEMLPRLEALRPRTRRKLGRIVMMIDPDAIDRIRDALRHPVLKRRLAAIAAADALAAVDLLTDSFRHISREDHQEARIRAATVMSSAESEETLTLLREMVDLPESPVRDAAVAALQRRSQTSPSDT